MKWTPASIHLIPPPPIASIVSTVTSMNLKCFCKLARLENRRLWIAVWLMAKTKSSSLVLFLKKEVVSQIKVRVFVYIY